MLLPRIMLCQYRISASVESSLVVRLPSARSGCKPQKDQLRFV